MSSIEKKEPVSPSTTPHDLILSITPTEEIIQFNKECEHLTGYHRDEVLHNKISDLLVPQRSLEAWRTLLATLQQSKWVDDFRLPLKTKDNSDCMVAWSGLVIQDHNGTIKNICLFGRPEHTKETPPSSSEQPSPENLWQEVSSTPQNASTTKDVFTNDSVATQQQNNTCVHTSQKEILATDSDTTLQEQIIQTLHTLQQNMEHTSKQLDLIHTALETLGCNYDRVTDCLGRLGPIQPIDAPSEHKQTHKQFFPKKRTQPAKTRIDTTEESPAVRVEQPTAEKQARLSFDIFGFRRQQRKLAEREAQLETRANELTVLEERLTQERKTFDIRIEEFCRWREKLELLESAIEKRRQELMKQEDVLFEQSAPLLTSEPRLTEPDNIKDKDQQVPRHAPEDLNAISQSAAIIQRGILKQVNAPFASLLGYKQEEIVEKSFFDFIAFDGLAEIEKYYLDRLKGESISTYNTVFSGKDNSKITVEVAIQPTMYNGEKAEVAMITRIQKH